MTHEVRVDWNSDGSVDTVILFDETSGTLMVLEDMGGGEWDLHIGLLHLSLGKRGLVIDAPAGLERPSGD